MISRDLADLLRRTHAEGKGEIRRDLTEAP
jgi:hypothetical protein